MVIPKMDHGNVAAVSRGTPNTTLELRAGAQVLVMVFLLNRRATKPLLLRSIRWAGVPPLIV